MNKNGIAYFYLAIFYIFVISCKPHSKEITGNQTNPENEVFQEVSSTDSLGMVTKSNGTVTDTKIVVPSSQEIVNLKNETKKGSSIEDRLPAKEIKPALPPEKVESMSEDKKNNSTKPIQTENPYTPVTKVKSNPSLYQGLLQKFVSSTGIVNYRGLKKEIAALETYTYSLSEDPTFEEGTYHEKLALWINAYNAFTLLMVTQNYPINSIRDLHSGKPWDAKWIRIGSKTYSLNQIENDIIRPRFKEPRIHFVLNCAAKSCPPLVNTVITSKNLEEILEKATKNFLSGPENRIQEKKLELSSIFDWYRDDFGNVPSFISKYSNIKVKSDASISYVKYNWSLND
ncbi:MAG: DUF547 domain-containing protein [Saprospiraceae bacterium]